MLNDKTMQTVLGIIGGQRLPKGIHPSKVISKTGHVIRNRALQNGDIEVVQTGFDPEKGESFSFVTKKGGKNGA
jgi:hypothetical protein